MNRPQLVLADEPTGNLDSATSESIIALFRKLNSDELTIVVVTHNETMANVALRRIVLRDGRIV